MIRPRIMVLSTTSSWIEQSQRQDSAARTLLVVVLLPLRDLLPSVGQIAELVLVQALVPEAPVETLHIAILRCPGRIVCHGPALLVGSLIDRTAQELGWLSLRICCGSPRLRFSLPVRPRPALRPARCRPRSPGTPACSHPRCLRYEPSARAELWPARMIAFRRVSTPFLLLAAYLTTSACETCPACF